MWRFSYMRARGSIEGLLRASTRIRDLKKCRPSTVPQTARLWLYWRNDQLSEKVTALEKPVFIRWISRVHPMIILICGQRIHLESTHVSAGWPWLPKKLCILVAIVVFWYKTGLFKAIFRIKFLVYYLRSMATLWKHNILSFCHSFFFLLLSLTSCCILSCFYPT